MNKSYYFKALCQAAGFNIIEAPANVRENPEDMTAYLVHKHIEGDTKTADVFYRVCEDFASDTFAVFPGKDGPVISDSGNLIADAKFGIIDDPDKLARDLEHIVGIVGHGLFVGMVTKVILADADKGLIEF